MSDKDPESDALREIANADDLDDMLNVASADDLDLMLQSNLEEAAEAIESPSAFDLDMMLSGPEPSEVLPSLDEIAFVEEAPPIISKKTKQWFVKVFNQELGPFDFDALHKMVHAGELSKSDPVRLSSEKEWSAAESLVGLFDGVIEAAIAPVQVVSGNISPQRAVTPLKNKVLPPKPVEEEGEAIWYCLVDGAEFGPMSFEKLQGIGELGKLSAADKVRFEGSGGWVPADSIGGLVTAPVAVVAAAPALPIAPSGTVAPPPAVAPTAVVAPQSQVTDTPAPRPAYTPPAYTPPPKPAPKKFTPPPKAKKSSSSMGNPFENLRFDPKVFGIIGVIILLGVGYFFMPSLAGLGDKKYYDETVVMYDKCVTAGDNVASLKAELEPRMNVIKQELEAKASSSRPLLRTLLDCYRYYFPKVLNGTEDDRANAMKGLQDRLAQAKTYL